VFYDIIIDVETAQQTLIDEKRVLAYFASVDYIWFGSIGFNFGFRQKK
jgi:hypothetical protein